MPVIGSRDRDGVDVFPLQNMPEVLIGGWSVVQSRVQCRLQTSSSCCVDIAHIGNTSRILIGLQGGKMGIGAGMQADDCEIQTVVGP